MQTGIKTHFLVISLFITKDWFRRTCNDMKSNLKKDFELQQVDQSIFAVTSCKWSSPQNMQGEIESFDQLCDFMFSPILNAELFLHPFDLVSYTTMWLIYRFLLATGLRGTL